VYNPIVKKKRVNLFLTVAQLAELRKLAKRTGESIASIVRRAIAEYLEDSGPCEDDKGEKS
jgi:hypothetical protein